MFVEDELDPDHELRVRVAEGALRCGGGITSGGEPWRLEISTAPANREETAAVAMFNRGTLLESRDDGWELRSLRDRNGRERRFFERPIPGREDVGAFERVYPDGHLEARATTAEGELLTA
jgi:hypothetical protein